MPRTNWKERALSAERRLDELNEKAEGAWYSGYTAGRQFEKRNRERLQELEAKSPERQDRLYNAIQRGREELREVLDMKKEA